MHSGFIILITVNCSSCDTEFTPHLLVVVSSVPPVSYFCVCALGPLCFIANLVALLWMSFSVSFGYLQFYFEDLFSFLSCVSFSSSPFPPNRPSNWLSSPVSCYPPFGRSLTSPLCINTSVSLFILSDHLCFLSCWHVFSLELLCVSFVPDLWLISKIKALFFCTSYTLVILNLGSLWSLWSQIHVKAWGVSRD